jgi:voltage-gated potassium channel
VPASPEHPDPKPSDNSPTTKGIKHRLWEIVFEAETPAGRYFDIALLWVIGISVFVVMLESVNSFRIEFRQQLIVAEWAFTIIFTIEYLLRIWLVRRPWRYIFSFYGIVDLLSCLPGYIALVFAGSSQVAIIRTLRLLRIFRVLKMVEHVRGANIIMRGLVASRAKITVFFTAVLIFAIIAGTLIYIVESGAPNSPFTDIPVSVYYAIVSITTVGYGDVTVQTALGKLLTSLMVLTGYAIIAVPTGIVAGDMVREAMREDLTTDACPGCGIHGHLKDAAYCRKCGERLEN